MKLSSLASIVYCALFFLNACTSPSQKNKTDIPLYLPDDLEATLWAESPMFFNPTNIDIDAKGRVWVTEAVNYRNFNNDSTKFFHHPKGDRVMILEDTDKDGVADKAKVFVQDTSLVAPLGIAVIGNKVIVSCAPNLIVYTDENGDDVPDKKEILLTGFGGKDHDHSLHALFGGPDGNWYFNTGNAGPHIVTDKSGWILRAGSIYTGGTPYNKKNEGNMKSDDGRVWVGGLALGMHPDGTGLKVLGHNFRNAYELTMDSYGNMWQNDNDDEVAACRTSWLAEGGNAGYFSTDGTRTWQADQRPDEDIFTAHWHQQDPGVMPVGDRSGAGAPTGIVVNEGDALGEKYRGMLLSADAGRNVIFGYHPRQEQSGFLPGQRSNFITSLSSDNPMYVWNDSAANTHREKWFRPSDVAIGTDGAIYVADWYDPVVGGHQMKDTTGFGRIYRIAPKNKTLTAPAIDLSNISGQIDAFCNPAINVRYLAFEALKQRGETAIAPVKALLKNPNPYIQARAIWLLAQLSSKGITEAEALLKDSSDIIRTTAFRALRVAVTDIMPYAQTLQYDPSPLVRRELAVALRDIPFENSKPILVELLKQYDGNDKWYLNAVAAACADHEEELYPEIVQLISGGAAPDQWDTKMSNIAWELHPVAALSDLMMRAQNPSADTAERKKAITAIAFIKDKKAAEAMLSLSKSKLPDVAEFAAYWLAFRQGNDWYDLLNWDKVAVNTGYQRKLAAMKIKMRGMLDEHLALEARKRRAIEMARDSVGGQMLIGLAADHKLPEVLMTTVVEKIFNNPDLAVRVQAGKYFRQPGAQSSFSVKEVAALQANAADGKNIFSTYCSTCHRIGREGNDIGPELTTIGKKFDKTALLDAIINPSAAILLGYEPWLINTSDGVSYFGFIVSENKQSLTIKDVSGRQHNIATDKIVLRQKQEKSLMPEPAVAGLSMQQLADVAAYLQQGAKR